MRQRLAQAFTALLLVLAPITTKASAQTDLQNPQDPDNWTDTKTGAPDPTPTCFVANPSQFEHDCFWRYQGPIVINVPVTRAIGDVAKLKEHKLIHKKALLRIASFDVDFNEIDSVYVNGNPVDRHLEGDNCTWSARDYEVPIEYIKFPDAGTDGHAPDPKMNEVKIVIDTASPQPQYCTAIDWIAIEIKVASPLVLLHGGFSGDPFGAFKTVWDPEVHDVFGLPIDHSFHQLYDLRLIEANIGPVGDAVNKCLTETGSDKVSLVTHSKGGIDGRAFIDNQQTADKIDQFIQMGVPNRGIPVFKYVLDMPFTMLSWPINLGLGLGGSQLTPDYMDVFFNPVHGLQPGIHYTSLAGDYDPQCSPCFATFMQSLFGAGDGLVPIWSARGLEGASGATLSGHRSQGNESMEHTKLHHSTQVRDNLFQPNIATFSAVTPPQRVDDAPISLQCSAAWDSVVDVAHVDSVALDVDHSGVSVFAVMYPQGVVNATLRSPSGLLISKNNYQNQLVTWEDTEIPGGRVQTYTFSPTEVGRWTAFISADSVVDASGKVGVGIEALYQSPALQLQAIPSRTEAAVGDAVDIKGVLSRGGLAETGASVSAIVTLNDVPTGSVTLLDNGVSPDSAAGDGIYTARITPSQSGRLGTIVQARGGGGQVARYSRSASRFVEVSQGRISGTPTVRSYPAVRNAPGYCRWLQMEADLTVPVTSSYRVHALLTDDLGQTVEADAETSLTAGARTVRWRFDGPTLFGHRRNGPWTLSTLRIAQIGNGLLATVGEWSGIHHTTALQYSQFQRPSIRLTGVCASNGVDSQSNFPGFDYLDVHLGVEVDFPAAGGPAGANQSYHWSGTLVDAAGHVIGDHVELEGAVPYYSDSLEFQFDGGCIRRNGVDGEYFLNDVVISREGQPALFVDHQISVGTYQANQFSWNHLGSSVVVEKDSVTVCPGGDMDTLRFHAIIPHRCGEGPVSGAVDIYAVKAASGAVVWDCVTRTDANGDTLHAYLVTPGAVADTAWFRASAISGCETYFNRASGVLNYEVFWGPELLAFAPAIWLNSVDLDRRAYGAVERWDLERYNQLNVFPSSASCNNFDWDAGITVADSMLFARHCVEHHHAPRHLFAPNGREDLEPGTQFNIVWLQAHGDSARVTLNLLRKYLPSYKRVIAANLMDTGSYNWTVPSDLPLTADLLVEVVHTAGVFVSANGDVGRDTSDAAFSFHQSGGGCPTLDVLQDGQYLVENTLLGRTSNGSLLYDNYHLVDTATVADGHYYLHVRENEQEESTIDNAFLAEVDHTPGVHVTAVGTGFALGDIVPAASVTSQSGVDLTSAIGPGGNGFVVQLGDTVLVDLGGSASRMGALQPQSVGSRTMSGGGGFVLGAMGKELPPDGLDAVWRVAQRDGRPIDVHAFDTAVLSETGILIQIPDGAGGWTTVEHNYPRQNFDESVYDSVSSNLVRLIPMGSQRIRSLGRLQPVQGELHATVFAPIAAAHTRLGDVKAALEYIGGGTTSLSPGDTISLTYTAAPAAPGLERSFFFLSRGVYTTPPSAFMSGGGAGTGVPNYAFALQPARPNPASGRVTFGYTLAQSATPVLQLYSVAGRLVRSLVRESQSAGPHEVVWDGTDNVGARVHAGVYFYRLTAGAWSSERKLVVITP
jgi:hypothetical protein